MNLYVADQGTAHITPSQGMSAVRLQVSGLDTKEGQVLYLSPTQAKLLGHALIANALSVQVEELKGVINA